MKDYQTQNVDARENKTAAHEDAQYHETAMQKAVRGVLALECGEFCREGCE